MRHLRQLIVAPILICAASTAQASLQICNDTDEEQSIAVGYEGDQGWKSRGWWNIPAGECKVPIGGDLNRQYYYLRAEKRAGPFEGAGYTFCTDRKAFEINGDSDCEGRGFETEDFIEIDIGRGTTNFTYRLEQAAMDAAQSGVGEGLQFCNQTEVVQTVAIGLETDEGWTSRGWWNVQPGKCRRPISGKLEKRYYYYRAEVRGGDFNGQGYEFCTNTEAFTIVGDSNCSSRGYTAEDFAEIDVGAGTDGYRVNLTAVTGGITRNSGGGSAGGSGSGSGSSKPRPTAGGFNFCNETEHTQGVAMGYEGPEGWVSEGWWNVKAGECKKPIAGELTKRYYYYRAEVRSGEFNGQGYSFCTSPQAFRIVGDTDCAGRGYDTEDFSEIDIGAGTKTYTFTLTSANSGIVNASNSGTRSSGLEICNETSVEQSVAIGYEGPDGWTSKGWWNVPPSECKRPLAGPLDKRYYYYRAEVRGGDFNGEEYTFCTSTQAFTITGDGNCEARGYETETFREIDIGAGSTEFKFTLVPTAGGTSKPKPITTPGTTETPKVIDASNPLIRVCNDSDVSQSVAFGYEADDGWTSEGWWVVDAGDCATPELDRKRHQYIYYRAEVDGGPFEGESYFFCTSPQAFKIKGDGNCEGRGYSKEDFREVEIVTDATFVLRLDGSTGGTVTPVRVTPGTPTPGTKTPTTLGDRLGGETTPVVTPTPTPEVETRPVVVPPNPDTGAPSNPRRSGSRG